MIQMWSGVPRPVRRGVLLREPIPVRVGWHWPAGYRECPPGRVVGRDQLEQQQCLGIDHSERS